MDRHLFDDAIGEAPPSTVDVDAIIARERRKAWVTPWAAAAAGVVVISLGAATVLATGGTTTPAAQCAAEPAAIARRLTEVLGPAVRDHLAAGTELVENPIFQSAPLTFSALRHPEGCTYFRAGATTVLGAERGSVQAVIGQAGGAFTVSTGCGQTKPVEQTDCGLRTGPNRESIVTTTLSLGGVRVFRVEVVKTDGTGIVLDSENVAVDAKTAERADSPAPPLTHEQLTAIALDPELTLRPG